jgi:hypothetical protein
MRYRGNLVAGAQVAWVYVEDQSVSMLEGEKTIEKKGSVASLLLIQGCKDIQSKYSTE